MNALVLGCGNIGSGYDLNNNAILTHAKAFHLKKGIDLFVFDKEIKKAEATAKKYKATLLKIPDNEVLKKMDLVSICVSTPYHYEYLQQLIKLQIPLIICEKPLTDDLKQLQKLKAQAKGRTKIFVNYIRRFQPAYRILKTRLNKFQKSEHINRIEIRYHRGFMNNCSHALDLIEFLLNEPLRFNKLKISSFSFDAFENDPTLSATFNHNDIRIKATGFTNGKSTPFEIDIHTTKKKIEISENGNTIKYFNIGPKNEKLIENAKLKQTNAIKNYMKHVLDQVLLLNKKNAATNFESSIELNKKMLNIISKLKKQNG